MSNVIVFFKKHVLAVCISIVALCVILFFVGLVGKSDTIGAGIGTPIGKVTGTAIGAVTGLTEGSVAGHQAGKEEGLSAEDTTTKISNAIREAANLEVLVASVKLSDIHSVGDDYKALYLLRGNAVFSVDLGKALVEEREDVVYISIPQPEMELVIDQSKIRQEAMYQKHKFSGDAEDGLDAYINSMKKIVQESSSALSNYDSLVKSAKNAATKQVEQLANSVSVKRRTVYISFQEEEVSES